MSATAVVLLCALDLLGRSASSFPPIVIIEDRPAKASANAAGFADLDKQVIYLIASAPPFSIARAAQTSPKECRELDALRLVASTIVHEEWHLRHGGDEQGAYYAQLMALQLLGVDPGAPAYRSVKLAMKSVLDATTASAGGRRGSTR